MYVLSAGEHDDADAAVTLLLPDARPEDLVVLVRRFADPKEARASPARNSCVAVGMVMSPSRR